MIHYLNKCLNESQKPFGQSKFGTSNKFSETKSFKPDENKSPNTSNFISNDEKIFSKYTAPMEYKNTVEFQKSFTPSLIRVKLFLSKY